MRAILCSKQISLSALTYPFSTPPSGFRCRQAGPIVRGTAGKMLKRFKSRGKGARFRQYKLVSPCDRLLRNDNLLAQSEQKRVARAEDAPLLTP